MGKGQLPGEFEQLTLWAVARLDGGGYGVSIRREIERRTGRRVSVGAMYATLDRLVAKGYICSRAGSPTPSRGGRAKRYYSLEPAGATVLEASRRMLVAMWSGVTLGNGRPS